MLRLGSSRVDKGAILVPEAGPGCWVITPVYGFVIRQSDGRTILVDTGLSPRHRAHPNYLLDPEFARVLTPILAAEDLLEARLGTLGLAVGDITCVINTHLHFDHTGNNRLFTARSNQAFVIYGHDHVQADELDYTPHAYA